MEDLKISILYGGAKVPFHLRNKEENEVAALEKIAKVKERAFSRGLPIIWGKNGKVIAEYANGKKYIIEETTITNIEYEE